MIKQDQFFVTKINDKCELKLKYSNGSALFTPRCHWQPPVNCLRWNCCCRWLQNVRRLPAHFIVFLALYIIYAVKNLPLLLDGDTCMLHEIFFIGTNGCCCCYFAIPSSVSSSGSLASAVTSFLVWQEDRIISLATVLGLVQTRGSRRAMQHT